MLPQDTVVVLDCAALPRAVGQREVEFHADFDGAGMRTNSWTESVRLGWSGKDKLDFLLRTLMDWSRFLGRKDKLLQATSRSRSHRALLPIGECILRVLW